MLQNVAHNETLENAAAASGNGCHKSKLNFITRNITTRKITMKKLTKKIIAKDTKDSLTLGNFIDNIVHEII